jgi:hypothetical protein
LRTARIRGGPDLIAAGGRHDAAGSVYGTAARRRDWCAVRQYEAQNHTAANAQQNSPARINRRGAVVCVCAILPPVINRLFNHLRISGLVFGLRCGGARGLLTASRLPSFAVPDNGHGYLPGINFTRGHLRTF